MSSKPLERVFGKLASAAFVVGTVVGTGIYLKPSQIASFLTEPWQVLTVWALAGVFVTSGALVYSHLARAWPENGGAYLYLRRAYGPWAASLLLAADIFLARPAAVGALSYGLGLVWQLPPRFCLVLAMVVVAVLSALQLRGARTQGVSQAMLTILQLLPLGLVLTLATFQPWESSEILKGPAAELAPAWGGAFLAVLWAYDGWYNITNLSGEVEDPEKNLPLALVGGMSFVTLLYLGINGVLLSQLGLQATAEHSFPLLALFDVWGLPWLGRGLQLSLSLALLATLNGTMACGARVMVAAAEDGLLHRRLGRDPTQPAPTLAFTLWCLGFLAIFGGLSLERDLFDILSEFTAVIVVLLSNLTVTCLFHRNKLKRRVPALAYGAAVFYLLGNSSLAWLLLREGNESAGLGVVCVLVVGTLIWLRRSGQAPSEGRRED